MKRGYSIILAASTAILLVTTGQPSFGENVPTQDEIVRALRPVPQALQAGHQGLPTIGAPIRPEPNPNYTRASTSTSAPFNVFLRFHFFEIDKSREKSFVKYSKSVAIFSRSQL